jgi:hypothetical protein
MKKTHGRSAGAGTALALGGLLALPGCAGSPQLAPLDSTIVLIANPTFIPANGGVSVISAVVTEAIGTPVPDGTVVQFFTSLGRIDREGRTRDGVARVNLVSDARSGIAAVTAVSGVATGTLDPPVSIGGVLPTRMVVIADPSRITTSRSTHIIATVLDGNGNPVPNVAVSFRVIVDPATEFMDSAGNPIFTDNNGRAEDVMRTRRTTPGTARVQVTAFAANPATTTVDIPILLQ